MNQQNPKRQSTRLSKNPTTSALKKPITRSGFPKTSNSKLPPLQQKKSNPLPFIIGGVVVLIIIIVVAVSLGGNKKGTQETKESASKNAAKTRVGTPKDVKERWNRALDNANRGWSIWNSIKDQEGTMPPEQFKAKVEEAWGYLQSVEELQNIAYDNPNDDSFNVETHYMEAYRKVKQLHHSR